MHFCTQYFSTNNYKTVLWSLQSFKNTSKLTEKHFAIAWHCLSGLAKQRTVHDMQEKANHTFINTLLTNTISYAYNKTGNTHIIAVHTFHHPSSWINYAKPKKTSPINPKQRREHQRLHGPNWTLFTKMWRGAQDTNYNKTKPTPKCLGAGHQDISKAEGQTARVHQNGDPHRAQGRQRPPDQSSDNRPQH